MQPMTIYPDSSYQTKQVILTILVVLVTITSWTVPVAIGIGVDDTTGISLTVSLALTIGLNVLLIVIALPFIPLYYRSLRYEIYEDEIVVHAGVITKSVKHVPFRTVTNLKVTRGPFDRLLGLGTLAVQTAGASGTTSAEESLAGLVDVQVVYDKVAAELRRFRRAMGPTQAGDDEAVTPRESGSLADSGPTLNAILDELRAIRARLDEF
jgi:membrane protein YdbS with pleckstrin-like domain